MTVFYNEIDPHKAEWLRILMKYDVITPGVVDERSIEDIRPTELMGYTQCHFFAGIGVWPYALRCAGWPDDRPVWTGSCPCQPFSTAGKGDGFADERHLWPAWYHLISQCKPVRIFGEQVASKDGLAWLDLVQADLEAAGYSVGPGDICAAGFGAPHIRQRLYLVADTGCESTWRGLRRSTEGFGENEVRASGQPERSGSSGFCPMADTGGAECGRRSESQRCKQWRVLHPANRGESGAMDNTDEKRRHGKWVLLRVKRSENIETSRAVSVSSLGNTPGGEQLRMRESGTEWRSERENRGPGATGIMGNTVFKRLEGYGGDVHDRNEPGWNGAEQNRPASAPGPVNGFWGNAVWIPCKYGKARAVEPMLEPLADGIAESLGLVRHGDSEIYFPLVTETKNRAPRIRGYGDAIVAPVAEAWIRAYMEERRES